MCSTGNWQSLCFDTVLVKVPHYYMFGAKYMENKVQDISNPFWHEVFGTWQEYIVHAEPKTISEILSEPLWYNTHLKKNLFIQKWFKNKVVFVKDLFDENGILYSFDRFKETYNVPGTFLDYLRLIKLIPLNWLNKIYDHDGQWSLSFITPISRHVQQMLGHSKGNKYAYDVMLPESPISKSEKKWQQILYKFGQC